MQVTQFGLTQLVWGGEQTPCADERCGRPIEPKNFAFIDSDGRVYCQSCGECLRFERKRASLRATNN